MSWMSGAEASRRIFDGEVLPDGLTVDGWLDLEDCTSLKALPDGLVVNGWLKLEGCTSLTAMPDGLTVDGWLTLEGCTSLTALPEGLTVGGCLDLGNVLIGGHDITISVTLPESVITALPGRRLRDLLDHPLLTHPDVLDTVIVTAEHQEGFADDNVNFLMLSVDRHLGKILSGSRPVLAEAA